MPPTGKHVFYLSYFGDGAGIVVGPESRKRSGLWFDEIASLSLVTEVAGSPPHLGHRKGGFAACA